MCNSSPRCASAAAPPSAPALRLPATRPKSSSRSRASSRPACAGSAPRRKPPDPEAAMCGIVTAVASQDVVPVLIEGLRKLEYRGYDSAGLAVLNGGLRRVRSTGRVAELAEAAAEVHAPVGIAHTRWATHGAPSERNAHPHVS